MPEFKYTATDIEGVIHSETLLADNTEEVRIILKKKGYSVINLVNIPEAKETIFDMFFRRVSGDDKAQFLEYFASMLEAGLTVSDSLQAFYEDVEKPKLRKFIKDAQDMIRNGRNLSDAFSAYPDLFPKMYSGMIQVGEASGTLAENLRHLAEQLKKTNELKAKVRNAMIYPAIIMLALGAILTIMMVFVIPKISEFFEDTNLELPLLTVILIEISKFLQSYWYLVIIFLISIFILYRRALASRRVRQFMGRLTLKVPIFGSISRTTNVALLSRTFGSLLSSGVNILHSVDVVKESMSNQVYVDILNVMKEDLTKGNNMSDSMKKYPKYFSPFEIRVIAISERTGEVAKGLKNVAEYYENKLYGLLTGLSSALEPILLMVMGIIVAVVALSVITPIFQLLTGIDQI
jgi:type II secretory pathway component PulF